MNEELRNSGSKAEGDGGNPYESPRANEQPSLDASAESKRRRRRTLLLVFGLIVTPIAAAIAGGCCCFAGLMAGQVAGEAGLLVGGLGGFALGAIGAAWMIVHVLRERWNEL